MQQLSFGGGEKGAMLVCALRRDDSSAYETGRQRNSRQAKNNAELQSSPMAARPCDSVMHLQREG